MTGGFGPGGWARIALRGTVVGALVFGGLVVLLILRLFERPLFGMARPITPYLVQVVCRAALRAMGIALTVQGRPMAQHGLVVANHASWLDIFALNAAQRVYFVSKSEVARWPGIGWLARATGTLFITRRATEAKRQQAEFDARLRAGHRLLFFPEGTSTDGTFILPFKPTLFAALYGPEMGDLWVQPARVIYTAPNGQPANFYGWWGDMDFAPHLAETLAAALQGRIDVILHPPLRVADYAGRKELAAACEAAVRCGV
ncbi:MAG: lysophospholipid acyltransferase family protein [Cypionkella sp.]|nr:lysophospholipid acyltransferase family protein [Cypionkella sp.]